MIFIARRKVVITIVFSVLLAISTILVHYKSTDVFSGGLSKQIIIDAGHGLPDGGAVGISGTIESTINIKIARLIEKQLTKKGYSVIMTRTGEDSLSTEGGSIAEKKRTDMYRRLEIIKTSKADMFVSIHMNKFTDERYRGAQVLYSGNFPQSQVLAATIQKELSGISDNESKRTHLKAPDGIFLLKNAVVPAVIIECGFLSNFEEEALLNTKEYQKQLATAIVRGIENYYERNVKDENIRNR